MFWIILIEHLLLNKFSFTLGAVQWIHGQEAERPDFPGPHLLPASEAYGGRQNPL